MKIASDEVKRNASVFYLMGVFLLIFCITDYFQTISIVTLIYFSLSFLIVLYLLFKTFKKSKTKAEYRRMKYIFVGSCFVVILIAADILSNLGIPLPSVGNIFLILYLYFLYQSLTKNRPLDIDEYLSRGILFIFLSLILTFIYLLIVNWIPTNKWIFIFNSFCASFVIIVLFEPVKKIADQLTKRLVFKELYEVEKDVEHLKHTLLGVMELGHFLKLLEEFLRKEIIKTHPIIGEILAYQGNAFTLDELLSKRTDADDKQRAHMESSVDILKSLHAQIIFPFSHGNQLIGFCIFANEKSTVGYPSSILGLLNSLSPHLGLTLSNIL
ncbi:MAG: hypothetical protein HYS98_06965 [Deltaproteobacteria bacterium]|nr:hypothetical protein [Deltaproteobacteria bacterium]